MKEGGGSEGGREEEVEGGREEEVKEGGMGRKERGGREGRKEGNKTGGRWKEGRRRDKSDYPPELNPKSCEIHPTCKTNNMGMRQKTYSGHPAWKNGTFNIPSRKTGGTKQNISQSVKSNQIKSNQSINQSITYQTG